MIHLDYWLVKALVLILNHHIVIFSCWVFSNLSEIINFRIIYKFILSDSVQLALRRRKFWKVTTMYDPKVK